MNNSIFLVKIVSGPEQIFFDQAKNTIMIKINATFGFFRRKKIRYEEIKLFIWGRLADDILIYYRVGDYVLVEGSVFFKKENFLGDKKINFTVVKFYPFLLY
uniref:Ycf41 n=1 Tax=Fibrocapsa japonica TaxID=94617 RepID=UPI00211587F5|nr:Ycf41 [Fibrocapsa japonica]UTE95256.1 Ycf41 [Fibrocapsa japonica]